MTEKLSHIDEHGRAIMVDVSGKSPSYREAAAEGTVILGYRAFRLLQDRQIPKGDVLAAARLAGIMAAKRVDDLIPLCHSLPLEGVHVDFFMEPDRNAVTIKATARITGKTGVEMEALTAVSVAALTIYDMCKAVEKGITIEKIHLLYNTGGKSGSWHADNASHRS